MVLCKLSPLRLSLKDVWVSTTVPAGLPLFNKGIPSKYVSSKDTASEGFRVAFASKPTCPDFDNNSNDSRSTL